MGGRILGDMFVWGKGRFLGMKKRGLLWLGIELFQLIGMMMSDFSYYYLALDKWNAHNCEE